MVLVGADPGEGGLPSAGEDEPQGRVVKSMHTGKVPVPLPPNYGHQLPVPPRLQVCPALPRVAAVFGQGQGLALPEEPAVGMNDVAQPVNGLGRREVLPHTHIEQVDQRQTMVPAELGQLPPVHKIQEETLPMGDVLLLAHQSVHVNSFPEQPVAESGCRRECQGFREDCESY